MATEGYLRLISEWAPNLSDEELAEIAEELSRCPADGEGAAAAADFAEGLVAELRAQGRLEAGDLAEAEAASSIAARGEESAAAARALGACMAGRS